MDSVLEALRGSFEELSEKLRQDLRSELRGAFQGAWRVEEQPNSPAKEAGANILQHSPAEEAGALRQHQNSPEEKEIALPLALHPRPLEEDTSLHVQPPTSAEIGRPRSSKKVNFGNFESEGTTSGSLRGASKNASQRFSARPLRRWVQADVTSEDETEGIALRTIFSRQNTRSYSRQNSSISNASALSARLGIESETSDMWASPRHPQGDPAVPSFPGQLKNPGIADGTDDVEESQKSSSPVCNINSKRTNNNNSVAISTRSSLVTPSGRIQFLERAIGLKNDLEAPRLFSSPSELPRLQRILESQRFEQALVGVIIVQTALVGLQIDDMAASNSHVPSLGYRISDLIMCSCFALELALKLHVHRLRFFIVSGWAWNVMDLFLIVAQIIEEFLVITAQDTVGSGVNFSVLRAIRMLRCVRILRVLRLTSFFDSLRRLVACMIHSVLSFVWSFVLLFLLLYMYGIYLTQSVHLHLLETGTGDDELRRWYGSVPQAILSLFQALTGGVDWNDIVEPLSTHMGVGWSVVTTLWMAFLILAVMNIITGNFVQNSIELAAKVKSIDDVFQAKRLFKCLDIDSSGAISTDEIHNHLGSSAVQQFFRSVDVDISEAEALFEILDVSGDGLIDCDEFISGCLRLQGGARAVDLVLMTIDTRRGFEHMGASLDELAGKMQQLQDMFGSYVTEKSKASTSSRLIGG